MPLQITPGRPGARLLADMAATAAQGRALGEAADLLVRMYRDPEVTVMVGLAGSLASAGQWKIITWMLRNGFVDVLVTTGANISEDLVDSAGGGFQQASAHQDDADLYRRGLNRYYDVVARERDYERMTRLIADFYATQEGDDDGSGRRFLYRFGLWLKARGIDGIVAAAAESQVPIYCPAIVDSAYGDAALVAHGRGVRVAFDGVRDWVEFIRIGRHVKETGVIYVGGGVPKDFIQTFAVSQGFLEASARGRRLPARRGRSPRPYYPHKYALQITADSPQWGGSSGASLGEGVSWGKKRANGLDVDCRCDATIALPLLIQALADQLPQRQRRPLPGLFEGE